jgi:hypothetical protein
MVASFAADWVVSAMGLPRGGNLVATDHKRGRLWVRWMTRRRGRRAPAKMGAMSALICRRPPGNDIGRPTCAIEGAHHERHNLLSALICRRGRKNDAGQPTSAIDGANHERLDLSALICRRLPRHDMGRPTTANQGAHRRGHHERLDLSALTYRQCNICMAEDCGSPRPPNRRGIRIVLLLEFDRVGKWMHGPRGGMADTGDLKSPAP